MSTNEHNEQEAKAAKYGADSIREAEDERILAIMTASLPVQNTPAVGSSSPVASGPRIPSPKPQKAREP